MVIKILGAGCSRCVKTAEVIEQTLKEMNIQAEVQKVTDLKEIIKYNVLMTPAVVIDEKVKISGKVPSKDEIKKFL
ncbi:MAG: TM0996/MTH895 family glutaredoxin-like protein [Spirochaetes bacterium]|nr:TM0996/MTH895 family glutaredoxin-like protein [Spirochaetota bacterium]